MLNLIEKYWPFVLKRYHNEIVSLYLASLDRVTTKYIAETKRANAYQIELEQQAKLLELYKEKVG